MEKFNSFVEKYNAAITELDSMTKPSVDNETRGIFSSESTIKGMKRTLESMVGGVGGGVGSLMDYGFDVDKDGKLSLDEDILDTITHEMTHNLEWDKWGTHEKDEEHDKSFIKIQRGLLRDVVREV